MQECGTARGGGVNGLCRAVPCRAAYTEGGGGKWSVPHRAMVFVPNKGRPIMEVNED